MFFIWIVGVNSRQHTFMFCIQSRQTLTYGSYAAITGPIYIQMIHRQYTIYYLQAGQRTVEFGDTQNRLLMMSHLTSVQKFNNLGGKKS